MKLKSLYSVGLLAAVLATFSTPCGMWAQENAGAAPEQNTAGTSIASIPLERLVTATCRQAWQMGGRTQDGFFEIVKRLTELSAQNRSVTLPDNKAAGARAGQWIRTQAMKDPDQLLYAVVDHAVQYSIRTGTAKADGAAQGTPAKNP